MAELINVLVDTSGSMAEDCKGAVVKYTLNAIASEASEMKIQYNLYLLGKELLKIDDLKNFKILYGGEISIHALRVFSRSFESGEDSIFISDGCFNAEIESVLSKYKDHIVAVSVGGDAIINNLQRCSRDKKVYKASDVIAALREI